MPSDPLPPAWLPDVQLFTGSLPEGSDQVPPLLFDDLHRPIQSRNDWTPRRDALKQSWLSFLKEIPYPPKPPRLEVLHEDRPDGLIRQFVRYEAEPGWPVEAYLIRPSDPAPNPKRPGAVVLHSTVDYSIRQPAGLEGPEDKHIGIHLARRGYVTFSPRCFLWQYRRQGQIAEAVEWLNQQHPGVTGMAKMLFDARRALDVLESLPDVDPNRLSAIGHSLGAKESLYLAAFDDRVKAAVSSEGGIGLSYSNWEAPWYLGDAIRRPGFPLHHVHVLALVAPRAFLLIGGDSADGQKSWPYIEAALPLWRLLGNPQAVGLFNHAQGHAFPKIAQDRAYDWLDWFLRP